jgi:hypothetical protein
VLIVVAIHGDRNVIEKEAEKILKYKNLIIEIQRMWKYESQSDTGNKRGDWNHLTITQTVPQQHNGRARN